MPLTTLTIDEAEKNRTRNWCKKKIEKFSVFVLRERNNKTMFVSGRMSPLKKAISQERLDGISSNMAKNIHLNSRMN